MLLNMNNNISILKVNVFRIKCSPYFEMLGESIGLLVEDSDDVLGLAGSVPGVTESVGRHAGVRRRGV